MKKRLLALVLCCAVVIGLVPAMVTAAYTDGTRLIVTCNGDSSDSVVLQQGETADLTAIYEDFMEEGDTLQWQKSQEGDWVNIPGETGEHLYVTSDMLDGQTGFRCTITGPEGNVTESNCVYVELAVQDEVPQDQSGTLFEDTAIELEEDTAIELEDGEAAEPAEDGEIVSDEPENSENSENSEEETTEDVAPEVETCEDCGYSDGEHSEDCSHYVPECTCGAEEGDVHDIDCPLYEEDEEDEEEEEEEEEYVLEEQTVEDDIGLGVTVSGEMPQDVCLWVEDAENPVSVLDIASGEFVTQDDGVLLSLDINLVSGEDENGDPIYWQPYEDDQVVALTFDLSDKGVEDGDIVILTHEHDGESNDYLYVVIDQKITFYTDSFSIYGESGWRNNRHCRQHRQYIRNDCW